MTVPKRCGIHLVGSMSVPGDTVVEAMQTATDSVGDRLLSLPDGEVGARKNWIGWLGPHTYAPHPEITQVDTAGVPEGVPEHFATIYAQLGSYRVKEGVEQLSLDDYSGYADAALSSYPVFRAQKEAGRIGEDVRFQVDLPTPRAAVQPFFGDASQWPIVEAAWVKAMAREVSRILEVVPPEELAIQWDYCNEVCDVIGAATGRRELNGLFPWSPELSADEALARHTAATYLEPMAGAAADEAIRFGYHLCLGTFPAFPTATAEDLSWIVRIANAMQANTPRSVDFFHLPSMPDSDQEFFRPLADLDPGEADIFLGIEHRDGAERILARGLAAREFLADFGISHFCGYGRDDQDHFVEYLADLGSGAELLDRASS